MSPRAPSDGRAGGCTRGDVAPVHAEMAGAARAAGGKNVWIVGGGDLVGQFHDAGLLDEIILFVAPVALGAGAEDPLTSYSRARRRRCSTRCPG